MKLALAVLALLLLAACTPQQPVVTNTTLAFKGLCKDIPGCQGLNVSDAEYCCYSSAQIYQNPEMCEDTGSLKDICYVDIAIKSGLPTLCQAGGQYKERCYLRLATKMVDSSLCGKAPLADQENCYSAVSVMGNDISGCAKSGSFKDACYHGVGIKQNNITICEQAGQFRNTCISTIAKQTSNSSLCGRLTALRSSCFEFFNLSDRI